jgi:hypothetical protein
MAVAFPAADRVQKITTGESLVSLLPQYKRNFDVFLSQIDGAKTTETVDNPFLGAMVGQASNQLALDAIDALNQGITSLQQSIQNKREYRKTTLVPGWVYWVFDWMGWGAVGRAEKELHRVIKEVFQRALNPESLVKDRMLIFLNALQPAYLQPYKDHALLKEIGKVEEVQKILCKKGLEKPDFASLLRDSFANDPVKMQTFRTRLLWVLEDNYDNLAKLSEIDYGGQKINIFQFMLKLSLFELADWMLENILPKCSKDVQKSFLVHSSAENSAVRILAQQLRYEVLYLANERPDTIVRIRGANHPLLKKLVSFVNNLSYPDDPQAQDGRMYYCLGSRSRIPHAHDKDRFLQCMLESKT